MIDVLNDNSRIRSEAIYKAKQNEANKKPIGTGLKILTAKQMLQRLSIALAQVKVGNNSEILLNEIRQTVYSLYQLKEITKKVYNNVITIVRTHTKFMNSKNSKTSKPHVLILHFTDKLDLTRGGNRISLSILSIYYKWKNIKSLHNNNKFKISAQTWNDNYPMDHILYQIFQIILSIF